MGRQYGSCCVLLHTTLCPSLCTPLSTTQSTASASSILDGSLGCAQALGLGSPRGMPPYELRCKNNSLRAQKVLPCARAVPVVLAEQCIDVWQAVSSRTRMAHRRRCRWRNGRHTPTHTDHTVGGQAKDWQIGKSWTLACAAVPVAILGGGQA